MRAEVIGGSAENPLLETHRSQTAGLTVAVEGGLLRVTDRRTRRSAALADMWYWGRGVAITLWFDLP